MTGERSSPYEARDRLVVTGDSSIELLMPRRFLIDAGHGRWIVTDRDTPTEDEVRAWADAATRWSIEGGPSVLFISECAPFDERLLAPMKWTVGAEPEPFGPPRPTAIQRRCWTLTDAPDDGLGQCWLYNGHPGDHQWGPAE